MPPKQEKRSKRTSAPNRILLGAHMSIAGGLHKAVYRGHAIGCNTVQLFTKSNVQWRVRPLTDDDVRTFREAVHETGIRCPTAHASYLINLASPQKKLYEQSIRSLIEEVLRCDALGIPYLVVHPGAHQGYGEDAGLRRVSQALERILSATADASVTVLLETTAGQGTGLGYRFEQLAELLDRATDGTRLGICLDTCHMFAAGYRLAPRRAYEETLAALDQTIGLDHVRVIHLNDSKRPLGSRVDRHAHIGEGMIGLEAFRLLINDPRLNHVPMYLETPKEKREGQDMDVINLSTLRSLVGKRRLPTKHRRAKP